MFDKFRTTDAKCLQMAVYAEKVAMGTNRLGTTFAFSGDVSCLAPVAVLNALTPLRPDLILRALQAHMVSATYEQEIYMIQFALLHSGVPEPMEMSKN